MKTYARVDGNLVVELLSTDGDITAMFHPDIVWVECGSGVAVGFTYAGGSFRPPVPANIASVKGAAWDAIKSKRDATKAGGVKVGTKWYHSDETSRTQYVGLLRMADAAVAGGGTGTSTLQYGGQDIQWKTMDGTFIKMTVQRANDVFNTVSGQDFTAFAAAETHRVAMEASADPASYDYSGGWPKVYGE